MFLIDDIDLDSDYGMASNRWQFINVYIYIYLYINTPLSHDESLDAHAVFKSYNCTRIPKFGCPSIWHKIQKVKQ